MKKLLQNKGGENLLHMVFCVANFPCHVVLKSAVAVASGPIHILIISKVKIKEFGKFALNELIKQLQIHYIC